MVIPMIQNRITPLLKGWIQVGLTRKTVRMFQDSSFVFIWNLIWIKMLVTKRYHLGCGTQWYAVVADIAYKLFSFKKVLLSSFYAIYYFPEVLCRYVYCLYHACTSLGARILDLLLVQRPDIESHKGQTGCCLRRFHSHKWQHSDSVRETLMRLKVQYAWQRLSTFKSKSLKWSLKTIACYIITVK